MVMIPATRHVADAPDDAPMDALTRFSPRPYIIMGYVTLFATFGILGGWALTAPLASGVISSGTVSVESSRKTVQHLEGGIVSEIVAREGEIVEVGDVVLRLDPTQALGNYTYLSDRLVMLQAQESRLVAENTNAEQMVIPETLLASDDTAVQAVLALQQTIFLDRKRTRDGQLAILVTRIEQLEEAVLGLQAQRDAIQEQIVSLDDELNRLQRGQESGVIGTNQLASSRRARLNLQGDLGAIVSEIAKLRQTISETQLQIVQVQQEFVERAGNELRDIRENLSETTERVMVAKDTLDRTVITAPVRGMLQNIRIHTIGGVVRAAEPVMDIIPLDDDLVILARVRPIDIDSVSIGMEAEVRFPAFSSKTTPAIFGIVSVVSQDVIEPTTNGAEPYYSARIQVSDADVPRDIRERLLPGMPADVIISTGERTFVEYLIRPLTDMFYKGMRER